MIWWQNLIWARHKDLFERWCDINNISPSNEWSDRQRHSDIAPEIFPPHNDPNSEHNVWLYSSFIELLNSYVSRLGDHLLDEIV